MEKLKIQSKEEIREVDGLGRVVIPLTKRKQLMINTGDKLEIYKSGRNIILKKAKVQKDLLEDANIILNSELEITIQIKKIKTNVYKNNHSLRAIDELGRLVIPIGLRKELNINEHDRIKICIKDDMIILIKVK